jgi:PhzF family phenazine biosynthesis protein
MTLPISVVDAFTKRPFAGNPAAVVRLMEPMTDLVWMQSVAAEMNLAETAFLTPTNEAARFGLRWFTPAVEVALCGHATLAAAHVLWTETSADPEVELSFETLSGVLRARRDRSGMIWLDFPALVAEREAAPKGLIESLGVAVDRIVAVSRSRFDWLVELATEADLSALAPDMHRLMNVEARGVIVTAKASGRDAADGIDFFSRFFAPRVGVPEDPVTGSAHCVLGPYWASKLGKSKMLGYQASRRIGLVETCVEGDRVHLGGHAVTTLRGTLVAGI